MSTKMESLIAAADFQAKLDNAALIPPALGGAAPPPAGLAIAANVMAPAAPLIAAAAVPQLGRAYVRTDGLNLRDQPSTNGQILKELTLGDEVEIVRQAPDNRWRQVRIGNDVGYVFAYYLRAPLSDEREALLRTTISEWLRFDKGRGDEKAEPYFRFVGEMWQAIGENYDGRSTYANGRDVPWSAAFISFVVRRAGQKYANFKFADAHSIYTNDAILARRTEQENKPFWGFRPTEVAPQFGDIIVRNRGRNTYTFDYAENHAQFISHSDIVVEVMDRAIRVLGGNVSDSVSMREYQLDANRLLVTGQKVIAVIKNRAEQVA